MRIQELISASRQIEGSVGLFGEFFSAQSGCPIWPETITLTDRPADRGILQVW